MKFLFHIHTKNSYDCVMKPGAIIDYASAHGIGVVAITDHDTIRGSVEAAAYARAKGSDVEVIIGAEYYSDCGDIIGLFLTEEIRERDAIGLIDEIHRQGGIVIVPHPFKGHTLSEQLLLKADIIETFNSRCTPEQNAKAAELALKYAKPTIVGTDAHCYRELPLCHNVIDDTASADRFLACRAGRTEPTTRVNVLYSQAIKSWKRKDVVLLARTLKTLLSVYIVQPLRRSGSR